MSAFLCSPSDMHPYECDGPGKCVHCDRRKEPGHDPETCALCEPLSPVAAVGLTIQEAAAAQEYAEEHGLA